MTTDEKKPASMLPVYGRAVLGMLPGRRGSGRVPALELTETLTIDPSAVARFCRVVGAPVANRVPPAYLHVLGFPSSMRLMTDPGFPVPVMGMVHIRTEFTQFRPVLVGEQLSLTVSAEPARTHPRGTEIGMRVRGAVAGQPVFDETWVCLAKGVELPEAAPAPARERTEFAAPVPTAEWRLDPGVGPRYARVSGDFNPIHLNPLAAKAFGFPRSIAHGMYTAARGFAAAGVTLDAFRWEFEFAKPVVLPAAVGYRVTSREPDGGLDYAVWSPKSGKPHLLAAVRPL